jgi:hypothetical protein
VENAVPFAIRPDRIVRNRASSSRKEGYCWKPIWKHGDNRVLKRLLAGMKKEEAFGRRKARDEARSIPLSAYLFSLVLPSTPPSPWRAPCGLELAWSPPNLVFGVIQSISKSTTSLITSARSKGWDALPSRLLSTDGNGPEIAMNLPALDLLPHLGKKHLVFII